MAGARGVPTCVVDHQSFAGREAFDQALACEIEKHDPVLVVLAGFMRVLGDEFVRRFEGRLMNVHPSLLPAFPGLNTHRRAIEAGVKIHGCTVHLVTPSLDDGPIIIQAAVPVLESDTEATLAARVLAQEHRILPWAVRGFVAGQLRVEGRRACSGERVDADSALQVPSAAGGS